MGKWCLHASSFIFDRIIFKVAGNQNRRKSSVEFNFGPNQTTQYGVTCSWVTKISHFWTSITLKPVGQSWSNFMCSIIGVGERRHKVLGQIDHGTLDSGEWSLPFGLLVYVYGSLRYWLHWAALLILRPITCLKFTVTYNGESEIWPLLLCHRRYLTPWVVLYQTHHFCPNLWIWLVRKFKFVRKKSSPQKP